MIYDLIENKDLYVNMGEKFKKAFEFIDVISLTAESSALEFLHILKGIDVVTPVSVVCPDHRLQAFIISYPFKYFFRNRIKTHRQFVFTGIYEQLVYHTVNIFAYGIGEQRVISETLLYDQRIVINTESAILSVPHIYKACGQVAVVGGILHDIRLYTFKCFC